MLSRIFFNRCERVLPCLRRVENGEVTYLSKETLPLRFGLSTTHLIIALIIAANADFPFVMTRKKDEIGRREYERNRPPDGSEEKTVWAGCDSVSRQRILGR